MDVTWVIGARKRLLFRIGHTPFRKQGARVHADSVTGSRDGGGELTVRERSDLHRGAHGGSNSLAVHFRHIYVDAHGGDIGNAEKVLTQTAVAGVDEVTHLCFASGDYSFQGLAALFKYLQLFLLAQFPRVALPR